MKLSYSQLSATLAAVVIACLPARAVTQQRTATQGAWQEVFRVDEEHGTMLYTPGPLALGANFVVLYDMGDKAIKAFSLNGKLLWKRGRQGGGPGEFSNPTDITVDARGNVYVLDPSNARISMFTANGQFGGSILIERQLHRLVVRTDGTLIGSALSDSLITKFSPTGQQIGSVVLPPDIATLPIIVRENRLLLTNSDEILVLHEWATRVLAIDSKKLSIVQSAELLRKQPFPPVQIIDIGNGLKGMKADPAAIRVLRAAAVDGDTLYVVDQRDAKTPMYFDAYLVSGLRYVSSRPVPERLTRFVKRGDLLLGIVNEPLPALVAWRWKGAAGK